MWTFWDFGGALQELEFALKIFNYFFTSMFVVEAAVKTISLGVVRYITDRYRDYQSHTGPD